jgi:MFS family permease
LLIVATLFVTNFLVLGSSWNTIGAFTIPLLKEFGWTHAKVASLWTIFGLFMGISPLLAGFLLDWIEARIVICAGMTITGTAFLLVSRSHSYPYLMAAYLMMGVGVGAATLVPAALVITNWFREKRGFPLGIVMAGTTVGGMILQSLSGYLIVALGWRTTYRIYSLPLFILLPLVWALVRSYPPGDPGFSARRSDRALAVPGLEAGEALHTRSFWLISLIQFDAGYVVGGAFVPAISYLTHIGYGYIYATLAASMVMGSGAAGKLLMGVVADRIGVRQTFVLNAALLALGYPRCWAPMREYSWCSTSWSTG